MKATELRIGQVLTPEKLKEMGFVRAVDNVQFWDFGNKNFHVMINPFGEVKVRRVNPYTDFVTVHCENLHELQKLLSLIEN